MNNSNVLHQKAMDFANKAVAEERKKNLEKSKELFREAYLLEREAAMFFVSDFKTEPSRSVLFRSSAFLALKAELYREAERMAAFGLSGNPPDEIADELREVFAQSTHRLKIAV